MCGRRTGHGILASARGWAYRIRPCTMKNDTRMALQERAKGLELRKHSGTTQRLHSMYGKLRTCILTNAHQDPWFQSEEVPFLRNTSNRFLFHADIAQLLSSIT